MFIDPKNIWNLFRGNYTKERTITELYSLCELLNQELNNSLEREKQMKTLKKRIVELENTVDKLKKKLKNA